MSSPSSHTTGPPPSLPIVAVPLVTVSSAVIVPGPGRRDDEIAGVHRRALAIDGGIGAAALDHKTQRRLRVAVRRRDLARQDQLQPGEQRAGDLRLPRVTRIFQDQHAAGRLHRADQPARLHQQRPHLAVISPEMRHAGVVRLGGDEMVQLLPQRRQMTRRDAVVKFLPFRSAGRDLLLAIDRSSATARLPRPAVRPRALATRVRFSRILSETRHSLSAITRLPRVGLQPAGLTRGAPRRA